MVDRAWVRIGRELAIAAFGVPLETIDAAVVDRLTEVFDEVYVRTGQVLWCAGGVVDHLWVMHDGRVRSTREGASPWSYEGRWLLGDLEGHLDSPATRTLVAMRDFYALKVHRRVWHGLLEDSFELTKLAVTASAKAVAELDARLGHDVRPRARSLVKWSLERPLSTVERIAFLAELPTARAVGVQALADLATVAHEVWLDDGRVLFEPGDRRDHFFFVVAGEVEAFCRRPEVLRVAHAGDVVGGAAALSEALDCWGARARGSTRLLAMPFEAWFDLMEAHFDLAQSTLAVLGEEREGILDQLACEAGEAGLVLR